MEDIVYEMYELELTLLRLLRDSGDHETKDKRESYQYNFFKSFEKKTARLESVDRYTIKHCACDCSDIDNCINLQRTELYEKTSSPYLSLWDNCGEVDFSGNNHKNGRRKRFTESDQLNCTNLWRRKHQFSEPKSFYEYLANGFARQDTILKGKLRGKVKEEILADFSLLALWSYCSESGWMDSNDLDCSYNFCPVVPFSFTFNFSEPLSKQKHCISNLPYIFKTFYCDIHLHEVINKLPSTDLMCCILLSCISITKSLNIVLTTKIWNVTKPEIQCLDNERPETCDHCCIEETAVFTDTDVNLYLGLVGLSDFTILHKTTSSVTEVKGKNFEETEVSKEIFDRENCSEVAKKSFMKLKAKDLELEKTEKTKEKCLVTQTEVEKKCAGKSAISKEVNSLFNHADDERAILMELVASDSIYLHHVGCSARETTLCSPQVYMMRSPATNRHPDQVMEIPWANFERETLRMASFYAYPQSAEQSAALLADSGFVYIGEGKSDKVICFFCHMVKEDWKRDDDIFLVHKSTSPHCPVVLVLQMNNVASITENEGSSENSRMNGNSRTQSIGNQSSQFSLLNAVFAPSNRSDSINRSSPNLGSTAPHQTLSPGTLAQNVQTSVHSNNQTRPQLLAPSSVEISRQGQPTVPNTPLQLNRNIRPHLTNANSSNSSQNATHPNINSQIYSIPRMPLSVQPVTSDSSNGSDVPVRELNLQDLGIFHERPKKPEYAILAKREESFEGWPDDCPVAKELVAKSGVYYEGYGDSGRCFFCGGGLRKWEIGDDPFVEHARWYPRCGYIRQYMGQGFVDVVQEIKNKNNSSMQIKREMVLQEMRRRGLTIANEFDEAPIENDPAVKSVLDEFKETQVYSREEIIEVAKALRHSGVTLSSDVLYAKLSEIRSRQPPALAEPVPGATAAVGSNVTEDAIDALREENTTLRNNLICKICMDKEVKIVFLPCGHLVSCQECSVAFVDCPICRSHIRAYVRATIR